MPAKSGCEYGKSNAEKTTGITSHAHVVLIGAELFPSTTPSCVGPRISPAIMMTSNAAFSLAPAPP